MVQYWTEAFTKVYIDALANDVEFQSACRGFDEHIQLRCLGFPGEEGAVDISVDYHIAKGTIDYAIREERAPCLELRNSGFDKKRFLARTTAPYPVWVKLDRKEMGVIDAILSPDYHFEGRKLKVLRHLKLFNLMGDIASRIPKKY